MENSNISKMILEKIKGEKIMPASRWKFILKNYFLWLFIVLAIVIGSLSAAIILFMLGNNDWDLFRRGGGWWQFIAHTIPYFWIVILLGVILAADYNFKHTKSGYRYHIFNILAGIIAISFIIGGIIYITGFSDDLEEMAAQQVPYYNKLVGHRYQFWNQPERGLLAGDVILVISPYEFNLVDITEHEWTVMGDQLQVRRMPPLTIGDRIKVIGDKIDENIFQALEIRPWMEHGLRCLNSCHIPPPPNIGR